MTTTTTQPKTEIFARVNGVEYCVEVEARPENEGRRHWVSLKEYQPKLNWWKCIYSESVTDCASEFEAVKYAFRASRARMNRWLESWRDHRFSAAQEHGGKRAYYTRYANEAKRQGMDSAATWKLCKRIWKEITKLT